MKARLDDICESVGATGAHRHKPERAAIAQVHLKSGQAGRADRANAAPVHRTKIARRGSGQGQGAHCRLNSVRPDHEIIVCGRAIGEPDRDATIVLHDGYDRCAESAADIGDTQQQRALQLGPFNSNARTCIAPQRLEIGIRQQVPLLIAKLPTANNRAVIRDTRRETKREQHAHAVGVDQDPGSRSLPSFLPLDQLGPEAMPMKRSGRSEARDASADDQDGFDLCHMPSDRTGSTPRGSKGTSRIGNRRSWTRRNNDLD